MPPRILQIIPTLDRSGAEKQLTLLACGLHAQGYDIHVCALTRGGPLADDLKQAGVPLAVIGKSFKIDPAAYWKLRKHIRALRPAIVNTWLFAANSYGRAAAKSAGVPYLIADERCVDPWKSWHELAIDRYLSKRSQRIVANSSGVRDFYVSHGLPADLFTIIPNGVAVAPPPSESREAILRELGLPAGAKLIGAIGRLWPQKRMKDLIWAADLLKTIRDDTHLLIIGDGPQRAHLEKFRDQSEISDRVHFLGHRADAARLLSHFDVLWLASEYEGMPNVVMEAMAAAVPVVATDIPGARDLIVPDVTGVLVPVGDRAAFAKHANQLLENPDATRRMGEAGRERVRTEFSIEQMISRRRALYDEYLS